MCVLGILILPCPVYLLLCSLCIFRCAGWFGNLVMQDVVDYLMFCFLDFLAESDMHFWSFGFSSLCLLRMYSILFEEIDFGL